MDRVSVVSGNRWRLVALEVRCFLKTHPQSHSPTPLDWHQKSIAAGRFQQFKKKKSCINAHSSLSKSFRFPKSWKALRVSSHSLQSTFDSVGSQDIKPYISERSPTGVNARLRLLTSSIKRATWWEWVYCPVCFIFISPGDLPFEVLITMWYYHHPPVYH